MGVQPGKAPLVGSQPRRRKSPAGKSAVMNSGVAMKYGSDASAELSEVRDSGVARAGGR